MASVVLFYGGYEFFQKTGAAVRNANFGMETLIVIGATTAWLYSTWNMAAGSIHLYYDTVSMLVTLVLLGKSIETRAKRKIQAGLEELRRLQPQKVRLCTETEPGWRYVSIEALEAGNCVRVEPDEIVPVDGIVQTGTGLVDESPLTGESRPIRIRPSASVKSGTRIVSGTMTVQALHIGDQSTLGKILESVEQAVSGKTPLETRTDRLLHWFVPLVVLLAVASSLAWGWAGAGWETAMVRGITVLVIACPCALGIAIPLARVAGIALASRQGIMVRDFLAFEAAEKLALCFLDKTGTMTRGDWRLKEIIPVSPLDRDRAVALAAGLESCSTHPVAAEIRRAARDAGLSPIDATDLETLSSGVAGTIEGRLAKIGSAAFIETGTAPDALILPWESQRLTDTVVYLRIDDRIAAGFLFGDEIRDSAAATVERLKNRGIGLTLVSGDNPRTTAAIGAILGIDHCAGGQMPEDKRRRVAVAQQTGAVVAMVGDGINDAPAMAQADISFAVPAGHFPGNEAADIILLRQDPAQVVEFLDLAQLTGRKIRQNLAFTFIYNTVSIPIAVSGLLTPLVAVTAMLMSSISVIGNTLLLLRETERKNSAPRENP
jgi:heavy metal translocating P-type ATPase